MRILATDGGSVNEEVRPEYTRRKAMAPLNEGGPCAYSTPIVATVNNPMPVSRSARDDADIMRPNNHYANPPALSLPPCIDVSQIWAGTAVSFAKLPFSLHEEQKLFPDRLSQPRGWPPCNVTAQLFSAP